MTKKTLWKTAKKESHRRRRRRKGPLRARKSILKEEARKHRRIEPEEEPLLREAGPGEHPIQGEKMTRSAGTEQIAQFEHDVTKGMPVYNGRDGSGVTSAFENIGFSTTETRYLEALKTHGSYREAARALTVDLGKTVSELALRATTFRLRMRKSRAKNFLKQYEGWRRALGPRKNYLAERSKL